MIQIFHKEKGILFVFFDLHGSGPVRIQKRKHQSPQKNDNQADKAEIFYGPERFGLFFFR